MKRPNFSQYIISSLIHPSCLSFHSLSFVPFLLSFLLYEPVFSFVYIPVILTSWLAASGYITKSCDSDPVMRRLVTCLLQHYEEDKKGSPGVWKKLGSFQLKHKGFSLQAFNIRMTTMMLYACRVRCQTNFRHLFDVRTSFSGNGNALESSLHDPVLSVIAPFSGPGKKQCVKGKTTSGTKLMKVIYS